MRKSISKIISVLILIIILPTFFFSVYEISNLNKNEQVIDSIYSSQLSSIVFSLNEYSNNAINWWAKDIDSPNILNERYKDSVVNSFLRKNPSINFCFFLSDSIVKKIYSKESPSFELKDSIQQIINYQSSDLLNLKDYIKKGYRKILPLNIESLSKNFFVFALHHSAHNFNFFGVCVNSEKFIYEKLGPKIQNMAQEKFFISVFDKNSTQVIYTNEIFDSKEHKIRIKERMWLFSNLEVGIQLKGDPIEQLVNKRAKTNTVLIILMDLVLLIGAWFVYRNIKHEIRLAQIKSDFVANVSHEIKTPLALINMYSETLKLNRIKTEEKKEEYINVIHTEATRLSKMVNKILNFSKIENDKRVYKFNDVFLNDIVSNIIEIYRHHFKIKGFSYNLKFDNSNNPIIIGDNEAINDAVSNLIDNAIKYSENKKIIDISTGITNDYAFIEIKDYGIGIPQKDQAFIFDKFFRVSDGNLAYKTKGSGIGLSIVKHIVDAHKGKIVVQSTLNKGSIFKLMFPLKK